MSAISLVTYRIMMAASRSFYGTFDLKPTEVGVSRNELIEQAAITAFLSLSLVLLITVAFAFGITLGPRSVDCSTAPKVSLTTLAIFGGSLVLGMITSGEFAKLIGFLGLATIYGTGHRIIAVSQDGKAKFRALTWVAGAIAGLALTLPVGMVARATETWNIEERIPVGAMTLATLLIVLAISTQRIPSIRDAFEASKGSATVNDRLKELRTIVKPVRSWSLMTYAIVLGFAIGLAPLILYKWASWSDGQSSAAQTSLHLGQVDSAYRSGLFDVGSVRPVTFTLVNEKDPMHVCLSQHPYAASLIGKASSYSWFLLRSLSSRSYRVVRLSQSDYAVNMASATVETSRDGTTEAWLKPAC